MNTFFGVTSQKRLYLFFYKRWARHFLKSNNVGSQFFPDCHGFCPDFHGFCPINLRDFAQIFDKSKLLGVRLHALHPASYSTVQEKFLLESKALAYLTFMKFRRF